jgi:hypothetical protein
MHAGARSGSMSKPLRSAKGQAHATPPPSVKCIPAHGADLHRKSWSSMCQARMLIQWGAACAWLRGRISERGFKGGDGGAPAHSRGR